jgi:hypothetical protein
MAACLPRGHFCGFLDETHRSVRHVFQSEMMNRALSGASQIGLGGKRSSSNLTMISAPRQLPPTASRSATDIYVYSSRLSSIVPYSKGEMALRLRNAVATPCYVLEESIPMIVDSVAVC